MVEKDFQLLTTKLFVPPLRLRVVARPQLLAQLNQGLNHTLTLVCAPAGYGKTTLLAEWIQDCREKDECNHEPGTEQIKFAWVSLDQEDNDGVRLMSYIATSLEGILPGIGHEINNLLNTYPPPALIDLLTFLINELSQVSSPIVLVMDDYQFISNTAINEGITFFLDHAPPGLHLIIATRSDPPIPTARFRARNQLLEIRADDLRFTLDETAQFLDRVMGVSLSLENIAALDQRTEGWIAGLQMAALSMHGRTDVTQFIEAFSGSHRYILDYLAEEVLNRQPADVVEFILRTSILDRMSAPLCEAVMGEELGQVRDKLAYLDHANLFLIPMDDERKWYRYHHLFADLLRARLIESQPNLVPELHLRASQWYEQNGFLNEAVLHAISAKDDSRAAEIIERYATIRWSHGDPTLIRLVERLPQTVLQKYPKASICWAWISISRGNIQAAFQLLDGLKERQTKGSPIEAAWASAFIDLLYAYGSQQPSRDVRPSIPDYHFCELIPEQEIGLREAAAFMYATLLNRQGDFERAAEILERCTQRDIETISPIAHFWVIALLARVRMMQGRLADAAALCRDFMKPYSGKQKGPFFTSGNLNCILGEVLYEWNQLEEAEDQIREGIRNNEPWHNAGFEMIGYSALATVQVAKRDPDGAVQTLRKLEELLQGRSLPADLEEEFLTLKVRLCLAKGDLPCAVELANKISATEPQDYMQEWGRISVGRVFLIQHRFREAQEAMEALNRLPGSARRVHRQIRSDLILAIAHFYQNQTHSALEALDRCLNLGEPGGYLRTFLDPGEVVRKMLVAYLQLPSPTHKAYAQRLLDAFAAISVGPTAEKSRAGMIEELTPREHEVLLLMAAGLSNRQIAERLVVAEGTVKFYVHAVLEKLDVHSRTQAIAVARERNLI